MSFGSFARPEFESYRTAWTTPDRGGTHTVADYIELNGVRTWYEEHGDGEPLVLLHGGFSDSRDFAGNLDRLANRFRLFLPERRGHGHTPDVDGPITNELMAADTISFLEGVVGGLPRWSATATERPSRPWSPSAVRTCSAGSC
jgi:hypothetical protein